MYTLRQKNIFFFFTILTSRTQLHMQCNGGIRNSYCSFINSFFFWEISDSSIPFTMALFYIKLYPFLPFPSFRCPFFFFFFFYVQKDPVLHFPFLHFQTLCLLFSLSTIGSHPSSIRLSKQKPKVKHQLVFFFLKLISSITTCNWYVYINQSQQNVFMY